MGISRGAAGGHDVQHFAGHALLNTDWNSANVIIDQGRAHIVDWAWATVGAGWLDAGYWVIWLIASGHHPQSAERWATHTPAWSSAPAAGMTAFAAANARLWAEIGGADPDPWTPRMAAASHRWHNSRHTANPR
jgi:hypothetical protein